MVSISSNSACGGAARRIAYRTIFLWRRIKVRDLGKGAGG
jgi:hypothetical protein